MKLKIIAIARSKSLLVQKMVQWICSLTKKISYMEAWGCPMLYHQHQCVLCEEDKIITQSTIIDG